MSISHASGATLASYGPGDNRQLQTPYSLHSLGSRVFISVQPRGLLHKLLPLMRWQPSLQQILGEETLLPACPFRSRSRCCTTWGPALPQPTTLPQVWGCSHCACPHSRPQLWSDLCPCRKSWLSSQPVHECPCLGQQSMSSAARALTAQTRSLADRGARRLCRHTLPGAGSSTPHSTSILTPPGRQRSFPIKANS